MKNKTVLYGLLIACVLAAVSFIASSSPDGLERVAGDKGFIKNAKVVFHAPLPDYAVGAIKHEKLSGSAAGLIGVLLAFAAGSGAALLLKSKKK
jgi:cobalt/nickel transport protein